MKSILFFCVFAVFSVVFGEEMSGNLLSETIPAVAKSASVGSGIENIRSGDNQQKIMIEREVKQNSVPNPVATLILNRPVVVNRPVGTHNRPSASISEVPALSLNVPSVGVVNVPSVAVNVPSSAPAVQNTVPVVVSHHRPCHVFRAKGHCLSIPNYFSCVREGGVLSPDIDECPFSHACCIRDFFNQFSPIQ